MSEKFIHMEKATDKGIPDVRKMYQRHQSIKDVLRNEYRADRDRHLFNPLFMLDLYTGMRVSPDHQITGTFRENGRFVERPMKWNSLTSPKLKGVKIISYETGNGIDHRVVLINRGDHVDYYNSTGEKLADLPPELVSAMGVGARLVDVSSGKHKHQGEAETCAFHSTMRACYKHLSDDEYNKMIMKRSEDLGINTDQLAYSKGLLTSERNITEEDKPPLSMKKGGLLKKGERSVPVPIIAHSGELVVPVDTVDDVLHSSAWKKHVKKIAIKKGVSMKDAFNISLGLQLQNGKWE